MTKVDDLVTAEVDKLLKELQKNEREIKKSEREAIKLEKKIDGLHMDRRRIRTDLEKARNQLSTLKRYVWQSDNPNIVTLRNEILMAAKLIKDQGKQENG